MRENKTVGSKKMVIGGMNRENIFDLEDREEYLGRFNFFLKSKIVLLSCDILNRIIGYS